MRGVNAMNGKRAMAWWSYGSEWMGRSIMSP